MTEIKNETGMDAIIVFGEKGLVMVFPEEFEVLPGQPVEWRIVPPKKVTVEFLDPNDSPVKEWSKKKNYEDASSETEIVEGTITGTIKRNAHGIYKFSVTDTVGNTIDPRIRVRK